MAAVDCGAGGSGIRKPEPPSIGRVTVKVTDMMGKFAKTAIAVAGMATAMLPLATQAEARPGWGGGRHWRGDRGVDGGDVLAGLLIIGGIAAIASAASNANNRDAQRDRDYRYRDQPTPENDYARDDWRQNGAQRDFSRGAAQSISDAVDRCVDEASRKGEVDEVFDAARTGNGYRVSGTLRNGDNFSCDVSGQGGVLLDLRRGQR